MVKNTLDISLFVLRFGNYKKKDDRKKTVCKIADSCMVCFMCVFLTTTTTTRKILKLNESNNFNVRFVLKLLTVAKF